MPDIDIPEKFYLEVRVIRELIAKALKLSKNDFSLIFEAARIAEGYKFKLRRTQ